MFRGIAPSVHEAATTTPWSLPGEWAARGIPIIVVWKFNIIPSCDNFVIVKEKLFHGNFLFFFFFLPGNFYFKASLSVSWHLPSCFFELLPIFFCPSPRATGKFWLIVCKNKKKQIFTQEHKFRRIITKKETISTFYIWQCVFYHFRKVQKKLSIPLDFFFQRAVVYIELII